MLDDIDDIVAQNNPSQHPHTVVDAVPFLTICISAIRYVIDDKAVVTNMSMTT